MQTINFRFNSKQINVIIKLCVNKYRSIGEGFRMEPTLTKFQIKVFFYEEKRSFYCI